MSYFELCHRPCKLCQRGSTLAVLGPNRTKVRLFNTNTDEMVGEIETALGECQEMEERNGCFTLDKDVFSNVSTRFVFFSFRNIYRLIVYVMCIITIKF